MIENDFRDFGMSRKIESYARKFAQILKAILFFSPAHEVFIPQNRSAFLWQWTFCPSPTAPGL